MGTGGRAGDGGIGAPCTGERAELLRVETWTLLYMLNDSFPHGFSRKPYGSIFSCELEVAPQGSHQETNTLLFFSGSLGFSALGKLLNSSSERDRKR